MKRARPDAAPEGGAPPRDALNELLPRLCLTRDLLARWSGSPSLEKLVRGKLVRLADGTGGHELRQIVGLEPATEAYTVDAVIPSRAAPREGGVIVGGGATPLRVVEKREAGGGPPVPLGYVTLRATTRVKLRTLSPSGTVMPLRLTLVSNVAPTAGEVDALRAAQVRLGAGWPLPDAAGAMKLANELDRLVGEGGVGMATVVSAGGGAPPVMWGAAPHFVLVLLRSWLAQDVLDEAAGGGAVGGEGGGAVGAAAAGDDAAVPEIFRPCVAEGGDGRGVDDRGYGRGPLRVRERTVGSFRYALQHRVGVPPSAGGGGGGRGGVVEALRGGRAGIEGWGMGAFVPLAAAASPYDEGQPCLTAWRALRAYCGDEVPLDLARDAIIAQASLGVEEGGGGEAAHPGPLLTPAGHPTTQAVLPSAVALLVVDADVLARGLGGGGEAGAKAWLRTTLAAPPAASPSPGPCPNPRIATLLADTARRGGGAGLYGNGEAWGRSLASTALSPTGLLWLDEAELEGRVGGVPAGGVAPPLHPSLSAALAPLAARGAMQDPLPEAVVLSEALVSQQAAQGLAGAVRARLWPRPAAAGGGGEGGAFAHATSWPPWPLYPKPTASPLFPSTWVPAAFPHRRGAHLTRLWHGTSPAMGAKVAAEGFRRAECRLLERCRAGACDDQMLGFGVYFGEEGKAREYALKRAVWDGGRGSAVGAVVVGVVDLGHIAIATPALCPDGCGLAFVDHLGSWYVRGGADALFLRDGSLPASRTREWAVADPARVSAITVSEATATADK